MTTNNEQRTTNKIIWIIFALVIIFIYFFGLTIPLVGPDEPRYSQVAREMFERGDWVTPTLGGFDWFEKPALLYWLQIASYKLFGVTEFAARFGSALFGLGTILSLWILGKFVPSSEFQIPSENTKTKDQKPKIIFSNWLALIAASSIGLIVFSRGASFDIILTFPITASLVGFFIFDLTQRREDAKTRGSFKFLPLALFYFFTGVALIAKGLVGAVFPFAIVAFYYLLQWKFPSKTFLVSLIWGSVLSLLVASAWYLPMYQANGWKFVDEFFIQHHFQRYTSNKYQHPQPFYFFLWVLPLMTIPWLPFFFIAIWKSVKNLIEKFKGQNSTNGLSTLDSRLSTFAWSWLLVPLVFFSFSGSKLPGYILPALPAALILTALYVYQFVQKSRMRKIFVQATALSTFLIVAVLAQFFVHDFVHTETVKNLIETANANGYKTEKIVNMHTISHSVEFYGAGRLVREADGKQKRFYGTSQLLDLMKQNNSERVLVLIPLEFLYTIKDTDEVETQILDDNGELAIVIVKKRTSTLSRSSEPIHQS